LWRGHITSTAPHKAGNIAPIQGRASPWQGQGTASLAGYGAAPHTGTQFRQGAAHRIKGQQSLPPTQSIEDKQKCRADKHFSSLAQETVSVANDFPYGSAQGNSPWTMSELSATPDLRAKTSQ